MQEKILGQQGEVAQWWTPIRLTLIWDGYYPWDCNPSNIANKVLSWSKDLACSYKGVFEVKCCWLLRGRPRLTYYFAKTNPLDRQPFQKQAMKQPAVSAEVIMGECGFRRPHYMGQGTFYDYYLWQRCQAHSPPHTSQIIPRMYCAYYLIVNPLTSQGYLFIHVVCTWSFNHKSINNYYEVT